MTVVRDLPISGDDLSSRDDQVTADRGGVEVRVQSRHLGTVLTITGNIDTRNTDRLRAHAIRLVPIGNALVLDLSGVTYFAQQGLSLLVAVEEACERAELPWALITSHAVDQALRGSENDDILPVASSVPDALQYLADPARVRQQVALPARRHGPPRRDDVAGNISAGHAGWYAMTSATGRAAAPTPLFAIGSTDIDRTVISPSATW
jgi:anti-anti-sigma factor